MASKPVFTYNNGGTSDTERSLGIKKTRGAQTPKEDIILVSQRTREKSGSDRLVQRCFKLCDDFLDIFEFLAHPFIFALDSTLERVPEVRYRSGQA